MKMCFKKKKDKVDLPRLDIVQDEWQSHTRGLPQGIPQAETSFINGSFVTTSCPPYNPMTATAPNTGSAFFNKMTALQEALKSSDKTQAVWPIPRTGHAPSSSLAPVHTVLRYPEEDVHARAQELSNLLTTPWTPASPDQSAQPPSPSPSPSPSQGDPPQPTQESRSCPTPAPRLSLPSAQPQAPIMALRLPNPFPVYTLAPGPSSQSPLTQDPTPTAQSSQMPSQMPDPAGLPQTDQGAVASPTPASTSTKARATKPQAPANGLMAASLARLRKSNKQPGP